MVTGFGCKGGTALESAFLFASALLLIGLCLRAKIGLLQLYYVPAAIIGGLAGLFLLQVAAAAEQHIAAWIPERAETIAVELRAWPGWLIAVVFAGLFLDKPNRSLSDSLHGAARQGNMVWIICLGQVSLGLAAAWAIIQPLQSMAFDEEVPLYFGHLIEAGFVGGHGTSAALGEVYENMGFPEAKDLAFFMATVGLIYSVVSGMFFVNLGVRRGWTRAGNVQISRLSGLESRQHPRSIGLGKVDAEVLDPLVFQMLILSAAYALGLALQNLMGLVYDGLPLFMFTLIGGWLVRDIMRYLGISDLIDADTIRRLVATAMELLIVAAIASLDLGLVAKAIVPLSILLVVAFAWTAFCLVTISRRLLPKGYWFELGLINYGMSTGVTASGLMLLRIIDEDFESGAAEDYALAAPLSSPFVGGGLVTIVVIPSLLQNVGMGLTALIMATATLGLYWAGTLMANRQND